MAEKGIMRVMAGRWKEEEEEERTRERNGVNWIMLHYVDGSLRALF